MPKLYVILVTIVIGLENMIFLAKSDIFIPKYTEGEGGGVHQFRKLYSSKTPQIFWWLSLVVSFKLGIWGKLIWIKKSNQKRSAPRKKLGRRQIVCESSFENRDPHGIKKQFGKHEGNS